MSIHNMNQLLIPGYFKLKRQHGEKRWDSSNPRDWTYHVVIFVYWSRAVAKSLNGCLLIGVRQVACLCVCVRKRWGSGGNNSKRKFHAWAGQCIIFSFWYITIMHDNDFEKDKYFNLHFEPQYLQINRLFIKVKISFH